MPHSKAWKLTPVYMHRCQGASTIIRRCFVSVQQRWGKGTEATRITREGLGNDVTTLVPLAKFFLNDIHPDPAKQPRLTSPIGRRTISWCQLEAAALGHFETPRHYWPNGFMFSSHVTTTICHRQISWRSQLWPPLWSVTCLKCVVVFGRSQWSHRNHHLQRRPLRSLYSANWYISHQVPFDWDL